MMLHLLACFLSGIAFNYAVHGSPNGRVHVRSNETVSEGCHNACARLSTAFGTALHYPDNHNFTIWDAKQQEVHPVCRVEPSSAADVSQILGILVEDWCRFAVKGGGHSRHPDDSNSVGGVTIDLNRINTVEIAANGTSARVGGGATSFQAYRALEPRNLSFVGGRVGTVGIGGFTLGGGTSPFSNKYGWALDNVFDYEIVLANGTITTASEDHNPDLYFALRGGSNNCGIFTTFNVRTFPQGPIYVSRVTWSDNQTEQVLDRVYNLFTDRSLTSDANMGFDFYYSYNQAQDTFLVSGTQRYERPIMDPPVFQEVNQIPPLTRTTSIATMANLTSGTEAFGVTRHLFRTLSALPSRALLSRAVAVFREEVEAISTVEGLAPNFICYPLQRNAIATMRQRGGNALGIDQDEPLFIFLISTGWSSVEGDADVTTMTTNIANRIKSASEELGVAHQYLYVNYASTDQVDEVFAGYGEESSQRLREIQKAVDPKGVFTSRGLWRGFMKLQ